MYEAHWGLSAKPFEEAVDATSYYPSGPHQGALLKLRYAVENHRGAAVLTGAAGVGKSMLVQSLFRQLAAECQPLTHVVFPQFSHEQLMAYLSAELTGNNTLRQPSEVVRSLQQFLIQNSTDGQHAVLAVDEAHLLSDPETLETLRLLLNFEAQGQPCLTVLLVGQPQMLTYLGRNPGFDDRIAVKSLLRPFNQRETLDYVSHRLVAAGATAAIFDNAALDAIFEFSGGIPRKINRLCDMALLIGFAEKHQIIGRQHVRDVAEEIVSVRPEAA